VQDSAIWQIYGSPALMSDVGQKQTSDCLLLMSAIPPKADIDGCSPDVRFVPKAAIAAFSAYNNPATSRTRRSGVVVGAKRARTTPALSTRNFVKFHFMLLPSNPPFCCLSQM
jgi:hypothetical protein